MLSFISMMGCLPPVTSPMPLSMPQPQTESVHRVRLVQSLEGRQLTGEKQPGQRRVKSGLGKFESKHPKRSGDGGTIHGDGGQLRAVIRQGDFGVGPLSSWW
jgi:uncharacterized protein involved in type VI secretion and phage assembly